MPCAATLRMVEARRCISPGYTCSASLRQPAACTRRRCELLAHRLLDVHSARGAATPSLPPSIANLANTVIDPKSDRARLTLERRIFLALVESAAVSRSLVASPS